MGRLRRSNMNVPYLPEAGQYRNAALHNFAVRRSTLPEKPLEARYNGKVRKRSGSVSAPKKNACRQMLDDYVSGAIKPLGLDFDVWRYKRNELYAIVVGAFEKHSLLQILVRLFFVTCPAAHFVARASAARSFLPLWSTSTAGTLTIHTTLSCTASTSSRCASLPLFLPRF